MLRLIPHGKVSNAIEYKSKEYGIETVLINEAYTSGVDSTINSAVSKENYTPDNGKLKGSPEFAVYKQIGVVRCGDRLGRIRCHKTQTPTEATTSWSGSSSRICT